MPPIRTTNCQICQSAVQKYKCPSCSVPYCSVACYKVHKERAHGAGPSSSSSSSSTRLGPGSSTSTPTSIAGTGPPPDPLPLPLIRLPGRIDSLDPNPLAVPASSSSCPTSNTNTNTNSTPALTSTSTSAHPLRPLTSLRWPTAPDETVFLDPLSADQVRPLRLGWVGAGAEAAGHGVAAGAGAGAGAEGYSALAMSPELRRLFGPAPGLVPASTSTSTSGMVTASTSTPTTKTASTSTTTTGKHNHKSTGTMKDTTLTTMATATKHPLLTTGPDLRTTLRHLRSYPRYARKAHLARLLGFEGDLAVDDLGGRPHGHGTGRGKTIRVDKVPEGGWYLPAFEVENKAPGRSSASSSYYIGEEETLAFRRFAECVRTVVGDQGQGQGQSRGGGFEWEV